jgi:hypothetical protein
MMIVLATPSITRLPTELRLLIFEKFPAKHLLTIRSPRATYHKGRELSRAFPFEFRLFPSRFS